VDIVDTLMGDRSKIQRSRAQVKAENKRPLDKMFDENEPWSDKYGLWHKIPDRWLGNATCQVHNVDDADGAFAGAMRTYRAQKFFSFLRQVVAGLVDSSSVDVRLHDKKIMFRYWRLECVAWGNRFNYFLQKIREMNGAGDINQLGLFEFFHDEQERLCLAWEFQGRNVIQLPADVQANIDTPILENCSDLEAFIRTPTGTMILCRLFAPGLAARVEALLTDDARRAKVDEALRLQAAHDDEVQALGERVGVRRVRGRGRGAAVAVPVLMDGGAAGAAVAAPPAPPPPPAGAVVPAPPEDGHDDEELPEVEV